MTQRPRQNMASIRAYQPQDRSAVYDICVRTGNAGADARHLTSDPDLRGHVYVGPYLHLCAGLAFVLEDAGEVVGYVVGADDTATFVARYRTSWLPRLAASHPPLGRSSLTPDECLLDVLHRPERLLSPYLAEYPSHLHINLLPQAQGRGHGRALITELCHALRACGSRGVHLGVAHRNTRARGFYAHIGFHELYTDAAGVHLGRRILVQGDRGL